eukprot:5552076-Pleurochrysis_carterae.AAC.1
MPSGRWKGPEKRSRTVLEACAGACASGTRVGRRSGIAAALVMTSTLGNPGGWSRPVSRAATATGGLTVGAGCFQGNAFSSKYTSEAPGVVRLRPKLMPTHARGSIRVFE